MTKRQIAKKLLAADLCHVDKLLLTFKLKDGTVKFYSSSPDIDLPGYTRLSLEELKTDTSLDNPYTWRIDAVTTPTLPISRENTEQLLAQFLPGCGNRDLSITGEDTPNFILKRLEQKWQSGLVYMGIKCDDPRGHHALRIDCPENAGLSRYAHTPLMPVYGFNTFLAEAMPSVASNSRRPSINIYDPGKDYPGEHIWMRRAVFEMLPLPQYHRIVYGESKLSRSGCNQYEDTVYMPYCGNNSDVDMIFNRELNAMKIVLDRAHSQMSLGFGMSLDMPLASLNTDNWWRSDNVGLPKEIYDSGFKGMNQQVFIVVKRNALSDGEDGYANMNLNCGTSNLRRRFVELHQGDALEPLIENAWEV